MTGIKQNLNQLPFQVENPNDELPVSCFAATIFSHLLGKIRSFDSSYRTFKIRICIL